MSHKQVIIVRKDLKMRRGKEIAQGCHASNGVILELLKTDLKLEDPRVKPWFEGKFKKVCCQVDSEQELIDLVQAAKDVGILACLITDSGLTEFNSVPTKTVAAIGPDTEENINKITGHLKLY